MLFTFNRSLRVRLPPALTDRTNKLREGVGVVQDRNQLVQPIDLRVAVHDCQGCQRQPSRAPTLTVILLILFNSDREGEFPGGEGGVDVSHLEDKASIIRLVELEAQSRLVELVPHLKRMLLLPHGTVLAVEV